MTHARRTLRVLSWTLLLVLTALPAVLGAQTESFSRFRAVDVDGQKIEGYDAAWDGEVLYGESRDGEPIVLARENLRLLDVRSGSQAGHYAAIGGGIGALLTLSAVLQIGSDPDAELDTGRALTVGAIATALGAGIGALAGREQSKWRNLQLGTPPETDRPSNELVQLSLCFRF